MKEAANDPIPLLSAQEFEARVKDYARFSHMVFIGDHVFIDNKDRRITRRMIIRALRKGTITGIPKWDASYSNWTGKMHYLGTGTNMTVVCAIQDGVLSVSVVTAYGKPKG